MVRSIHKTNIIYGSIVAFLSTALMGSFFAPALKPANTSAANSANVKLQANIIEALTVSLTTPDTWASGDLNSTTYTSDLLRNKVNVAVRTNNGSSYSVGMYAVGDTTLVNTDKAASTIATLTGNTTASAFPANRWGYSLTDNVDGLTSATYLPMSTNAIEIFDSNSGVSNKDVFFGAKADADTDSGTYSRTVAFSAVTGVDVPTDPTNPATPETPANQNDTVATYTPAGSDAQNPVGGSSTGVTTYTTTTSNAATASPAVNGISGTSTTTTTQVTAGDTTATYSNPQGVTTSNISGGTPLATTLAAAAVVSALAGTGFYFLAKKQEEDEEEQQ